MKKILIALFIVVFTLSFSVCAEVIDSGECGDNLTWSLDDEGTLVISGTGDMWDYDPTYNDRLSFISPKKVVLGKGVTSIGDGAFFSCDSLTSVIIPDSVTRIGDDAFGTSLTSISIPDSVTRIGDDAFGFCGSLTSITVDKGNKHYSNDKNGVLFNKDKTTLIKYPMGNTNTKYIIPDSVTSIGNDAFGSCDSLTSVIIPDSVTRIGDDAFGFCTSLTSISIPDSVTSIGNWGFCFCVSLTSITVDKGNKHYSNDKNGVLFNKDKTTLIQYPVGNTNTKYIIPDSVTSIGDGAFGVCDNLTSITIPDSVTSIGDGAFYNCTALETVCYQGTEEEWNRIVIGEENSELLDADIVFIYTPKEDSDETANATEESNKADTSLMIVIVVCVTIIVCLCIVATVIIFVVKSKNPKY